MHLDMKSLLRGGKRKKENGGKTYKEKPHDVYCILLILHCPYLFFFCCLFIDVAFFFLLKYVISFDGIYLCKFL